MELNTKYKIFISFLTLEILLIVSVVFLDNDIKNIQDYILVTLIMITTMIGLTQGLILSLISSMLCVAILGTLSLYRDFISTDLAITSVDTAKLLTDYIWIALLPVVGYTSGSIGDIIKKTFEKSNVSQDYLKQFGCIDAITNLKNEKFFYIDTRKEMSKHKRYGYKFSVIMVKVKYFEEFKSIYSDVKGEMLIRSIADIIMEEVRVSDDVYTMGEDTFAILLTATEKQGADIKRDRIAERVAKIEIDDSDKKYSGFDIEVQVSALEYSDDEISPIEFKNLLEKELIYSV